MPTTPHDSTACDRVLVIEDETRLRDVLLRAIPDMGFHATAAPSAEHAVRIMEDCPHDIAVLDLNLPDMDGLDLFSLMCRRWPDTAVIILTGFGDLEAARSAIRLNVVDFLTKPASLGDLEMALDRAHRRRMRVESRLPDNAADPCVRTGGAVVPDSMTLEEIERAHILNTLDRNGGNRAATATDLGISVRKLYYRLAEYQRQGYLP